MNKKEDILKKIEELQNTIEDSKDNATPAELAEYLMKVNHLQAMLQVITEDINKK